ncbi:MAG: hypothetical protein AAF941_00685 [Pseudomonadota bacterium]
MAFPFINRPISILIPCLALLTTVACSSADEATTADAPENEDPPGAALPLSIGGRAAAEGESVFEISVNCAAALDLTAERLAQMVTNSASDEIALLGRAKNHFEARAEDAGASDPEIITSPAAAIARRRNEKIDETSEQAQLAIACLRQFGDEVG